MKSIIVSLTVFALVFSGALIGMGLARVLPENQLGAEAKDVIHLAIGLLVTMTALVLGMLVSTANSSYQDRKKELAEMASNFVVVDRLLGAYGPDAQAIRSGLRDLAENSLARIWPSKRFQKSQLRPRDDGQFLYDRLQALVPQDAVQAAAKATVMSAVINLRRSYWLLFLGSEQSALSYPLLVVVVAWLATIFISFGLFAPHTLPVILTLLVCAMAVSGAIFIIMAMYAPFSGVMKISPLPIRDAMRQMES
jgi:hypothetical protein